MEIIMETPKIEGLESGEQKERIPKNVVIIERPEARYRIIYGLHETPQKAEDVGNADALVLEWGVGDYSTGNQAEKTFLQMASYKQYQHLIGRLEKREKPIFLADVSDITIHNLLVTFLRGAESITGFMFIGNLAIGLNKQGVTRREFLKSGAKGIAALYFLSNIPLGVYKAFQSEDINEFDASQAVSRFLNDLDERMHPETNAILLTLRNHLFAQKLKTIANTMTSYTRGKPEVGIVIGARHTGIEAALQKEDKGRVELVDRLLHIPGLGGIREKIATIARMDFDKDKGRWVVTAITKDPHLAPLEG